MVLSSERALQLALKDPVWCEHFGLLTNKLLYKLADQNTTKQLEDQAKAVMIDLLEAEKQKRLT
jgi:hypothetical protein